MTDVQVSVDAKVSAVEQQIKSHGTGIRSEVMQELSSKLSDLNEAHRKLTEDLNLSVRENLDQLNRTHQLYAIEDALTHHNVSQRSVIFP